MKTTLSICLAMALAAAMPEASAQDPDAAAERARLANQRILAESERRRRDASDAAAAQAKPAATATPAEPAAEARTLAPVAAPAAAASATQPAVSANGQPRDRQPPPRENGAVQTGSVDGDDMSVVLEQLKALGELKDAGYVSDDEFERIKRRILDENL